VDTDQLPLSTQYVALSHCWGTETFFCLTQANLDQLKQHIPFRRLSKVFQDAIVVLRRFGMRHVWIDSLCIIQDQLEDWQIESSKMGDVYRNSLLNIAAAGFGDGGSGLFVDRDRSVLAERILINADLICDGKPFMRKGSYISVDFHFWMDEVGEAPLNRRAWVVQERLLSPRTLHFGSNQLLWECYEFEACESFPEGFPREIFKSGVKSTCHYNIVSVETLHISARSREVSSMTSGQCLFLFIQTETYHTKKISLWPYRDSQRGLKDCSKTQNTSQVCGSGISYINYSGRQALSR
jgi:hypothetical protein